MLQPIALFAGDFPPGKPPLSDVLPGPGHERALVRVLVVDDEILIAQTIAAILNQNGFHARTATSAEEAIQLARQFCPDVVLSDVVMPGMSGVDLGISIRQEFPGTRVVLFSGQSSTADLLRKGKELGHSFELLPKPIHPDDLIARLKEPAV